MSIFSGAILSSLELLSGLSIMHFYSITKLFSRLINCHQDTYIILCYIVFTFFFLKEQLLSRCRLYAYYSHGQKKVGKQKEVGSGRRLVWQVLYLWKHISACSAKRRRYPSNFVARSEKCTVKKLQYPSWVLDFENFTKILRLG